METLTATTTPLATAKRVVVKVGSALLVDPANASVRSNWLGGLARDISRLRARGQEVVIVSSGSIALGRAVLGFAPGALSLERAQAAAAVGQPRLLRAWEDALSPLGAPVAQVLLTLEDTENRRRYLNARSTLGALLAEGALAVVNENDTVATDEIRYGDNDRLAARVALMVDAGALILLSDVDGLYTGDPRHDPEARHLPEVGRITPQIEAMAGGTGSAGASGGMRTKLLAAKTALKGGCAMVITRGDVNGPIGALEEGARATWFLPPDAPQAARKRWIAAMKPRGRLAVDEGAARALARGKSLLPAGVRGVDGRFERGDPIAIVSSAGAAIGAALSGYGADEARAIAGVQTDAIEAILGYPGRAAMVHADDMVIWDNQGET